MAVVTRTSVEKETSLKKAVKKASRNALRVASGSSTRPPISSSDEEPRFKRKKAIRTPSEGSATETQVRVA